MSRKTQPCDICATPPIVGHEDGQVVDESDDAHHVYAERGIEEQHRGLRYRRSFGVLIRRTVMQRNVRLSASWRVGQCEERESEHEEADQIRQEAVMPADGSENTPERLEQDSADTARCLNISEHAGTLLTAVKIIDERHHEGNEDADGYAEVEPCCDDERDVASHEHRSDAGDAEQQYGEDGQGAFGKKRLHLAVHGGGESDGQERDG